MTKGGDAFLISLKIQIRIIKALIIREIITRWGRKNIGFLWIFGEQLILYLFYWGFWLFSGRFREAIWPQFKLSLLAFILLGHASVIMWRNCASMSSNSLRSNQGLFHHKNLRPLDFYLSRIFLEIISASGGFLLALFLLELLQVIPPPQNIPIMLAAWVYLIWFSIGFSLIVGTLLTQYEFLRVPWQLFSLLFFITSGAFFPMLFVIKVIPEPYLTIVKYNPAMQINEMLRHGYYGNIIPTFYSSNFMTVCNTVLLFCGLLLVYLFNKKIPDRI